MTDTVFDSAVGPASAAAEVPVDPTVLDDVRSKLRSRGLDDDPQVVLLGLDGNGCVSVGRFDTSRGTVADTYADAALSLGALDRAIADHLTRIGRVESPTSPEWQDELFELISRGRERLQDSDGTFLMGRRHIRLFRMARRDVEEAGGALIARGEELARAAVAGAQAHAVVIADGLGVWPGLRDGIAKAVPVPIVDAAPGPLTDAVPAGPLGVPQDKPEVRQDKPEVPQDEPEPTVTAESDATGTDSPPTTVEEPAADSNSADSAEVADATDSSDPAEPEPVDDRDETPASMQAEAAETSDGRESDSEAEVEATVEPESEPAADDTPEPVLDAAPEDVVDSAPEDLVDVAPERAAVEVTAPTAPKVSGSVGPDDAPTGKLSLPFDSPSGSPGRSGDFPVIGAEQMFQAPVARPVDHAPATAFGALTAHSGPPPVPEPVPVQHHTPVSPEGSFRTPRPDAGHPGAGPAPDMPPHANVPAPEPLSLVNRPGPAPVRPRREVPAKRVLAGVALVCALAIIGVAVALAAGGSNGSSPAPVAGPTTPTTTAPTTQEYADPAIFAEARQPAQRYTPPPPPVATNEPAPAPRPRSRAPRPQRGVTIPNPIPGLPPIVLP
ncbi:hypothetical protein [Gordonia alkanivorans]|uniref:hypothetical protein n=1 Tax=Gordonia alkanivorans TaxID=84096 RepID=UPI00244CC1E2|nr:hypothetical protein [Gordonia alkanivorans]MDH3021142.1 hypothetical protein [Gordonia alkanivorans]MDJ0010234.1 hypothetical protein [Gordonia alkanivorans]MDJ0099902.1 hypothetical protein [Gordonia alkanivorans]MDJ0495835.1 hypothetical protein [Gordonia alkanivorans]